MERVAGGLPHINISRDHRNRGHADVRARKAIIRATASSGSRIGVDQKSARHARRISDHRPNGLLLACNTCRVEERRVQLHIFQPLQKLHNAKGETIVHTIESGYCAVDDDYERRLLGVMGKYI
jgi:hypothetical protein